MKPLPTEDVIDILADYGVTAIPSTSNMKQLILQVSETELISKPFMCITKLREGMGSFWEGVYAEEIHAVYSISPVNVLIDLSLIATEAFSSVLK